MDKQTETIAAIATAPGFGGVGIVRLSGPESHLILSGIFRPGSAKFNDFKPWMLHHGHIVDADSANDGQEVIDEVLAVFMPGPRTFTGEDVAEVHCHGGPAILEAVLELIFKRGARLAQPGEFTRRAFLNGRMDLAQAEAVAEAIAAPAREALRAAQAKLGGALSGYVEELREALLQIRAGLTLAVDWPEEELDVMPVESLLSGLMAVKSKIAALIDAHKRMRSFREGALVVIAGQVNTGKSSLLNALLGKRRAIVTDIPGTTRDFLEEQLLINNLPVRLVDTAGYRKTRDEVERQGLDMAEELFAEADLILLLVDILRGPSQYELELLKKFGPQKILGVANKCDLGLAGQQYWPEGDVDQAFVPLQADVSWSLVSAKSGTGIEALALAIEERILKGDSTVSGPLAESAWKLAPNLRQVQVLELAEIELLGIIDDVNASVPYDLLGVRVELLSAILGEVSGEVAADDVLDRIFAEFCLGK